ELILDTIERSVTDENQDEVVLWLGVLGDLSEYLCETRTGRRRAREGVDVDVGAGGLQHLVEIRGAGRETLLVVGFAHQAGDRDGVHRGASGNGQQQTSETHAERGLHTMPHLRRTSHSAD